MFFVRMVLHKMILCSSCPWPCNSLLILLASSLRFLLILSLAFLSSDFPSALLEVLPSPSQLVCCAFLHLSLPPKMVQPRLAYFIHSAPGFATSAPFQSPSTACSDRNVEFGLGVHTSQHDTSHEKIA